MAAKKVLVTGAAGFIGSHIARALAERGHEVTGVDNFLKFAGGERPAIEGFELVELDLCDDDLFRRLGTGWDEAYHLAAVVGVAKVCARPALTIRNNTLSTIRFLDWARTGVGGRVLFASSCENYASFYGTGLLTVPTPEEVFLGVRDVANPRWCYASSKLVGELAFMHWGLDSVVVRYHNVYGPSMYSRHVIPELFSRIWQGENPLEVVSASDTRAFCHVRDATAGTIAAMEQPEPEYRLLNIGSDDEEIAIGDLARRMVAVSGRDTRVVAADDLPGSVSRRRPDISRMAALLGDYRFTSLDEGLEECWAWQKDTRWIA